MRRFRSVARGPHHQRLGRLDTPASCSVSRRTRVQPLRSARVGRTGCRHDQCRAATCRTVTRTIVPGHNDVCGPAALDDISEYLQFVAEVASTGHRLGNTPLQAALDVSDHPHATLPDGERLAANLHRAYAEIDGAEPGAPIDLAAARRDMVSFHDGPLRMPRVSTEPRALCIGAGRRLVGSDLPEPNRGCPEVRRRLRRSSRLSAPVGSVRGRQTNVHCDGSLGRLPRVIGRTRGG